MIARFFIDRPIFATVLSVVITLLGGIALYTLPMAQYPRITPPGISITMKYPGASAPVVADTVAAPIEQQVNGIEGMLYMSSQMGNDGSYTLTVTFDIGVDVNTALVMVQNRVALAKPQLPTSVQNQGITIRKRTPDMLLIVNFYSPDGRYDDVYLSNFATIYVRDELLRVEGVSDINYMGQRDYSVRAWLNPQSLAARNMTAMDVAAAIRSQNIDAPAGQVGQQPAPSTQPFQFPVSTLGRLTDPEQFGNIIVKVGESTGREPSRPITRLRDVATLELGAQNYNQACSFDGYPSVGLSVYQLPGTNALTVGDRVRAKMEELKARFPDGVEYAIGYDTTTYVHDSVFEVFKTLRDAVIIVGLVVLIFLQDWRAMILPMIDVPVSLIGTFAVMAVLGFSLNNLTLFGLVLAIGIVVDDAIVVLENTERLIGTGLDARSATIKAMEEITGPILAITLALCSVFVPCCFLEGITGQFFRQFAVTIAASTIISAVNAMTMTPSRAVLIFRAGERAHAHKKEALPWWAFAALGGLITIRYLSERPELEALVPDDWPSWVPAALAFVPGALAGGLVGRLVIRPVNVVLGWFFRGFNAVFDGATWVYGWIVGRALRLSAIVLLAYGGLIALTYAVFDDAPTGFIPTQDQGRLIVNVQLPDSASLQRTQEAMATLVDICMKDPAVKHTVTFSGMSFIAQASSSNFGAMFIVLKPFDERRGKPKLHAEAVMARLRPAFASQVKDARVNVYNSSPIPGLGAAGGYKIVVEDRASLGLEALQAQTDELTRRLNAHPLFTAAAARAIAAGRPIGGRSGGSGLAATQFRSNAPQLFLAVDRTKVQSLGLTFDDVNQTLSMYLGSLYVNSFNEFGRLWQVTIQVDGAYRNQIEDINLLKVRNRWGEMVPLGTLVKVDEVGGPISVTRYNLYESATISGSIPPGLSSGDAIKAVNAVAAETLPLSMRAEWTELVFMQIRAGNSAIYVFSLAAVSVFLALAALYESWSLPLAVILVVPLCLLCSVSGVLYSGRDVNVFVQIGLVVLVGLACKNAILIVEFAKQLQDEGMSRYDATLRSCKLRLRPILMTSLAFIFGVVPLVVASGAGSEMRRSLGVAVFSGMIGVTLFGIFLTPVFYSVIRATGESGMRLTSAVRWLGSVIVSTLLAMGTGWLLNRLGVVSLYWGLGGGAIAGILAPLAVLGAHALPRRRAAEKAETEEAFR